MFKKSRVLVLLGCLCLFVTTCSRVRHVPQKTVSEWDGKKKNILRLKKISGEVIEFSKKGGGRIEKDEVVGQGSEVINIEKDLVEKRIYQRGSFKRIITKDGKEYQVAECNKSKN